MCGKTLDQRALIIYLAEKKFEPIQKTFCAHERTNRILFAGMQVSLGYSDWKHCFVSFIFVEIILVQELAIACFFYFANDFLKFT